MVASRPVHVAALVAAALGLTPAAHSQLVSVEIRGEVDFNVFQSGAFQGVPAGAAATIRFDVDAAVFVNSPTFPTRGYPIIPASFTMTAGAASAGLLNPLPVGVTPFFVLRDNDPAVDGFVISRNVDFPIGVPMGIGVNNAELNFLRTFNDGTALTSLDIADAAGTYDFTNLSVYRWTIDVGPGTPMEVVYQSMTITVIPAPPVSAALLIAASFIAARRRPQYPR